MAGQTTAADLYQLTMMAGYYTAGVTARGTFELYVRTLPPNRSFLVAAGLEQALEHLEAVRFSTEDIEYFRGLPVMQAVPRRFFDEYLPRFRFTGDVWAVDEGTPVFPPEPLLRVSAPLPEAQFVETALLAHIGFQTSVASRAARMVQAAAGRAVVEFGARRAHGLEAGVLAARAAYLSGCAATSNMEAGRRFGIPVSGTMAHAWVTAFPAELDAFRQYSAVFGDRAVLLLDTYDTVAAAELVAHSGLRPHAVRLDSGDLAVLSREVRSVLDGAGLHATQIFVSGDLDEWRIDRIVGSGAPVDGFGVGAALSTVSDAPSLGAVYKLVEVERGGAPAPVMKRSPGKETYPGSKQIWRMLERGGAIADVLELEDVTGHAPPGRPLMRRVVADGRRVVGPQTLTELRAHHHAAMAELPAHLRELDANEPYPVRTGAALLKAVEDTP